MAVLTAKAESSSGFQIDELAPSGDYVATCIDIADEFSVPRKKYQSEEMEDIDVTRFLFGLAHNGKLYKVQTFEMRISGSPKSSLYKFLTAWLGKAPEYGWDYCTLKGQGAVISVEHVVSQMGTTYSKIARITPAKTSLADYSAQIIPIDRFTQPQPPAPAAVASPTPTPSAVASAPAPWNPQAGSEADCPF